MILFKITWGIDAIVALIILYFFFAGLADGTVSERNMSLWLFIMLALAGIMWGSIWLRGHGHPTLAMALLLVLAIPALLFGLYFGIAILNKERWN
ncbi:MAG: hypothetical protein ABJB11_14535 [Ferruginibacter sp.]